VILNANATIGGDGYGFAQDGARHVKIPQIGTVEIGDDVEIGAGSTVDRAAMGATTIGRGTKIDNLVMVGHGCTIGEDVLIVAQSGMAGSATIGDRAILAARAGVLGHLTLGAGTLVYSRAHVTKSTPEGAVVSGNPARPHKEQLRRDALLARIDQLNERVAQLERRVGKQDEQK
jgi:UDP-3-O-[3-hydroxymyristoyl] glucosamine N-acyltransferase